MQCANCPEHHVTPLCFLQIYASRGSIGVHRSPLQPEETHSLGRSGDISRMLPFEMHLLAAKRASRQDAQGGCLACHPVKEFIKRSCWETF